MRFSDYRDRLLVVLASAAERKPDGFIDAEQTAYDANLLAQKGFLREAVRDLEHHGYIRALHTLGGSHVQLTGRGWDEAERLKQDLQVSDADVPGSDRYVTVDHNSREYAEATEALDKTLEAVRGNNAFAEHEAEDYEQRIAEIESGKRLLKAARVRLEAIIAVLAKALRYISTKFGDATMGALAAAALAALAKLLGVPLPL